jgi:hypothetical protein
MVPIGGSSEESMKYGPVNNDIPTRSRLLNFDTCDWIPVALVGCGGTMITQAKAIGVVISAGNQKTQRHDVYCTKIALMIRPSTDKK